MNLPQRYPYNPTLRLFFFSGGAGVAWLAVQRLSLGCPPTGFSLWFGLLPIFLGMLLAVRKLAFDRYVLLDADTVTLPAGIFRLQQKQIPYSEITAVWQSHLPYTGVIRITTKRGNFEILSTMLSDRESYLAIGDFLYSRAQANQSGNP